MTNTNSKLNDRDDSGWVKFDETWTRHSLSLFLAMVIQGYRVQEISHALNCSTAEVIEAAKKYSILLAV